MRILQMAGLGLAAAIIVAWPHREAAAQNAECKGLAQQSCESAERCSWVSSYTTAKGTEVKAFCRRKAERKQTSEAPQEAQSGG